MKISTVLMTLLLLGIGFFLGNYSKEYEEKNSDLSNTILEGAMGSKDEEEKENKDLSKEDSTEDIVAEILNTEDATIALFERSTPSVCYITATSLQQDRWSMNIFEIPQGSGTGFIWDEDGHIVTNYHVIEGGSRFTVTLNDQNSYEASVVGYEPNKDLAVLRIIAPGQRLKPITVGRSSNLRVGQSVFAIGNPFGLDQSLTTGIISAVGREIKAANGRPIKNVIQTDAAINPGNSGGPLLDSSGKVIGVNTAIYSPSGASAGIGFSIPIDVVSSVVPDIIKYGEVRRPVMGIELVNQQYHQYNGSMILEVGENTPAQKAGLRGVKRRSDGSLRPGDLILQINQYKIESNNDLVLALEKFAIGDKISIKYNREKQIKQVDLTLASSLR